MKIEETFLDKLIYLYLLEFLIVIFIYIFNFHLKLDLITHNKCNAKFFLIILIKILL